MKAAFAIPGDIDTLTGGYRYEKRLLGELRAARHDVAHIALPAGFPDPSAADTGASIAALTAVPPEVPLILDGFIVGALDPAGMAAIRAPIVAMVHHPLALESGLTAARRAWLYDTERANLAHAAHVLVPSPHTATILQTRYGVAPGRISIALPGTDRPACPPARTQPPLILSVGLHHPRKGHDVLLRALHRLPDLEWRAHIMGRVHDPAAFQVTRALARDLDLSERVTVDGEQPEALRDARYAEASIFALASEYEGYGMVFDEALVRGLPIVSCRAGAIPDTVPPDAGLLVPVGDDAAMAHAIRRLLTQPGLRDRMAGAAARHGAALPTWADTAAVAGRVLDRVMAQPPNRA